MKYTIGLDLGGTKLAAALLNSRGEILDYIKIPLELRQDQNPHQSQKRVFGLMRDVCVDFRRRFPRECRSLLGVGLASAGPLNVEAGELVFPVNFSGWKRVPIKKNLESLLAKEGFKIPVFFQNDAMSSAFAELWVGKAQGLESFAVITVGTGIGTGVIFRGIPCQTRGMGSEFGHLLIDSKSKERSHGTVEGLASGTGLVRRARDLGIKANSVEDILHLGSRNEKQMLFNEMARALGILAYNLSIGFNLEGIFISGGLVKIKESFLKEMIETYKGLIRNFNPDFECRIQIAGTGNKSGVVGAGYLPWQE